MRRASLLLLAPVATGCFAIADLDRFEDPELTERNLVVHLMGFDEFVGSRVELRVVGEGPTVDAVAVIDDMPKSYSFLMRNGILPGRHSIDVYVDANRDGDYTVDEPSWRRGIPPDGEFTLSADETTTRLDDPVTTPGGQKFLLNLTRMEPHMDQSMDLVVVDQDTEQTRGYYHISNIRWPNFSAFVPGIVTRGSTYTVAFYADVDGNGECDSLPVPPGDHQWQLDELEGGASGITSDFEHNKMFTEVCAFFPEP